jgi:2-polyprenyl-3-methyl-5-hydroxy-6-metoxy-1,4-benzoquinol methylase
MNPEDPDATERRAREEAYYRDLWSREAWGQAGPNPDETARAEKILALLARHVRPAAGRNGLRILDLGCGRGWLTRLLSNHGNVIGIDPVTASVDCAHQLHPGLDFRHLDASALLNEVGEGYFDLVVSSEVIEHVDRPEQPDFLRNVRTLLAPGGFAILTTPRGELQRKWERRQPEEQPLEKWLSETELRRLCIESGFAVCATERAYVRSDFADPINDFVRSRYFAALARRWPGSRLLARLRHHVAIYQVILVQRP